MKIIVKMLIVCMVVLLSACAQLQAKLNADLQALAEPDLEAAIATAQAANDPNPNHLQCYQGLLTVVQALQTTTTATPAPSVKGLASLGEAALLSTGPTPITLPTIPTSTKMACNEVLGELQVKGSADALKFQAALLATVAKFKL